MTKRVKRIKIQRRLFQMMFWITLLMTLLFLLITWLWRSQYLRQDRLDQFKAESVASFSQVDGMLTEMHNLSLNVAYSGKVMEQFSSFLNIDDTDVTKSQYQTYLYNRELTETLLSMIGPTLSVPQVYIYSTTGSYFGTGIDNSFHPSFDEHTLDWLSLSSLTGFARYTLPHNDPRISGSVVYERDNTYVSVMRSVSNKINDLQGYIEVVQRYDKLFQPIMTLEDADKRVYVFSRTGELIYPSDEAGESAASIYYTYQESELSARRDWITLSGERYAYYGTSTPSAYIYAVVIDSAALTPGFGVLTGALIAAFFLMLLGILPVCYAISRSFSTPIQQMNDATSVLDLSATQNLNMPEIETDVAELAELSDMIRRMLDKIQTSSDRLLLMQQQEIQARVLALQAQTNPHFIYNTFINISALAASGRTQEIEEMCGKLAELLRYSSSARDSSVPLSRELHYTLMYVQCMQIRFPTLSYTVDAPESVLEIQIPKLMIQLLVENSIKFCARNTPPWDICVQVRQLENRCRISILDNGPGFDEESLAHLHEQMQQVKDLHVLPELELNGMGLLNIYLRLTLIFGDSFEMTLGNHERGALVQIEIPC